MRNGGIGWVDAAKGISITLVVLLHATGWVGYLGGEPEWLNTLNRVFASVRMPLFFCMAGLFAGKWLDASWPVLLRGKALLLVWVFLIWQPVVFAYKFAAALTLPDQQDTSLVSHLGRAILSPVRPNGETWFLWALAIYFIAAKILRRLPLGWHLVAAAGVSAAWLSLWPHIPDALQRAAGAGWENLPALYLFFAAGILGKSVVLDWADRFRAWAPAVVAVWLPVALLADTFAWDELPGVMFALKCLGLAAGVSLGVLLSGLSSLRALGRNTLAVYVAHLPIIAALVIAAHIAGVSLGGAAESVAPFVLAAVAIPAALLLHKGLSRVAPVMYRTPEKLGLPAPKRDRQAVA